MNAENHRFFVVPPEKRKSNFVGWLILATLLVPMIIAYAMFKGQWGIPAGTTNKGELIQPAQQIGELPLVYGQSLSGVIGDSNGHWRIVIVGTNHCDDLCRQQLYLTRQVHTRLGEKSKRVERFYLNVDPSFSEDLKAELLRHDPRLKLASVNIIEWRKVVKNDGAINELNGHSVFLVDQDGFAMMRYGPGVAGADYLKDLKRLLKYSYGEEV